jgi:hypothetical protein
MNATEECECASFRFVVSTGKESGNFSNAVPRTSSFALEIILFYAPQFSILRLLRLRGCGKYFCFSFGRGECEKLQRSFVGPPTR